MVKATKGYRNLFSLLAAVVLLAGLMGCSREPEKEEFVLVTRMMDIQNKWFRAHLVKPFEQECNCRIVVSQFDKVWDLEKILSLDRGSDKKILLVKTPLQMMGVLKKAGLMAAFEDFVPKRELAQVVKEYDPIALKMGSLDGKLYYLPRKLETRIMIFLKSKVTEAQNNWQKFKPEIDMALKEDNGFGLPRGYRLEADPNLWDYYDIFVAGYYWAHTPYQRIKLPRVAHRARRYEGTVQGLFDRALQLGAEVEDLVMMDARPIKEMFLWEAAYKKHGIYNPSMWQEGWSGGGIWNAMKDGKVFLAWMHQIDAFFIHGGSSPRMRGSLKEPDDLGFAIMPLGVSFTLDNTGRPEWSGSRRAATTGWGWGVPGHFARPELSWRLARFITSYANHLEESRTFGMMPVRKDILQDLNPAFPEEWMRQLFNVSYQQLGLNRPEGLFVLPNYGDFGKNYLDAWYHIVVDGNYGEKGKVEREFIAGQIRQRFLKRQNEIRAAGGL
jgi:ABC-type glycerol-3-phosphate transport system substrate-binding protein